MNILDSVGRTALYKHTTELLTQSCQEDSVMGNAMFTVHSMISALKILINIQTKSKTHNDYKDILSAHNEVMLQN